MFGNLGNMASLLKQLPEIRRQAQEMQGRMRELQESLGKLRVEGSAGGGMVKVEATGQQQIVRVTIEDSLLEMQDREMLEDLIAAATNQALEKAREAVSREMSRIGSDINIPGLDEALSQLGLDNGGPLPT